MHAVVKPRLEASVYGWNVYVPSVCIIGFFNVEPAPSYVGAVGAPPGRADGFESVWAVLSRRPSEVHPTFRVPIAQRLRIHSDALECVRVRSHAEADDEDEEVQNSGHDETDGAVHHELVLSQIAFKLLTARAAPPLGLYGEEVIVHILVYSRWRRSVYILHSINCFYTV